MSEEHAKYEVTQSAFGKIAPALVKFQGEITNPQKNKTVNTGKYGYSYADLGSILDHVRPALAKHGLAVVQRIVTEPESVTLETDLIHESGQIISCSHPLPRGCAAQEFGSFLTYARRYSLGAILGLAAEDDDDGQAASKAGKLPSGKEDAIRAKLEDHLGTDCVSNVGLVRWCQAEGLIGEDARIADDLPLEVVEDLLSRWPDVVAGVKAQKTAPKGTPVKPANAATKTESKPTGKPESKTKAKPATKPSEATTVESGESDDPWAGVDDLPPQLVKLMRRDEVTPALLKAVYVAAGHFPDSVEPSTLPDDYVAAICEKDTWAKLAEKAATIEVPF